MAVQGAILMNPQAAPAFPLILQQLYDADTLEEEHIHAWCVHIYTIYYIRHTYIRTYIYYIYIHTYIIYTYMHIYIYIYVCV